MASTASGGSTTTTEHGSRRHHGQIPRILHPHINTAFPANVCLVGSVLPDGYAQVTPRGSTMVYDDEHIALWERGKGSTNANLRDGTEVTVYFRKPQLRAEGVLPKGGIARFYGPAKVYKSGPVYEEVWRRLVQPEKDRDPQKAGYAVLIKVERAEDLDGQPLTLDSAAPAAGRLVSGRSHSAARAGFRPRSPEIAGAHKPFSRLAGSARASTDETGAGKRIVGGSHPERSPALPRFDRPLVKEPRRVKSPRRKAASPRAKRPAISAFDNDGISGRSGGAADCDGREGWSGAAVAAAAGVPGTGASRRRNDATAGSVSPAGAPFRAEDGDLHRQ